MKYLTIIALATAAMALGACSSHEPARSSTTQSSYSASTGYSK